MKLPDIVQPHTVTIEEYEGEGAYGPQYSDSYEVNGYYQEENKYIRNDEGDEVTSSSQFFTSADIKPPQKSKLTFDGNENEVMTTSVKRNAITGKISHVQVMLL